VFDQFGTVFDQFGTSSKDVCQSSAVRIQGGVCGFPQLLENLPRESLRFGQRILGAKGSLRMPAEPQDRDTVVTVSTVVTTYTVGTVVTAPTEPGVGFGPTEQARSES
jgi:hypothetical protein